MISVLLVILCFTLFVVFGCYAMGIILLREQGILLPILWPLEAVFIICDKIIEDENRREVNP